MCDDVVARFQCAEKHEERGEDPLRMKYHAMCDTSRNNNAPICAAPRDRTHVLQEDEDDKDCPECRGETPPETP